MRSVDVIKKWREAATLLVVSQRPRAGEVLVQTRAAAAASFANVVVFPGGVHERADGGATWQRLLTSYGYRPDVLRSLHRPGVSLTPLFLPDPVQRHIDLRITAIRETFEETGLLLCSRRPYCERLDLWADCVDDIDLKYWRQKVSENPEEFFNLCEQNNCYPDIWSLHYWSNWLTPTHLKNRFDTAFFVAAIKKRPDNLYGNSESSKIEWSLGKEILEKQEKKESVLLTPQIYELRRLGQFKSEEEFIKFAKERSPWGADQLFPVISFCKDGSVFILPGCLMAPETVMWAPGYPAESLPLLAGGICEAIPNEWPVLLKCIDGKALKCDDHYPANVDYNQPPLDRKDKSVHELRAGARVLHRLEITKSESKLIIENYAAPNHVTP